MSEPIGAGDWGAARPLAPVVPVDIEMAIEGLRELGDDFIALVRSIGTPDAPTRGLEWTLAETAAHVLQTVRVYEAALTGELEPESDVGNVSEVVARKNEEELAAEPERDPAAIAVALAAAIDAFNATAHDVPKDRVAVFSTNYAATAPAVVCGLIAELAVHGWDIARSLRRRWRVQPATAAFAAYASAGAVQLVFDAEAASSVKLHVKVKLRHASAFSIRVEGGRAWGEVTDAAPDATLWVDPLAYLLLAYGRTSPFTESLRGRVFAYGRRPWMLAKLPKVFRNP